MEQATATIVAGGAVDLAVAGTTSDHRYVSYRFLGDLRENASSDLCAQVLPPRSGADRPLFGSR